MAIRSFIALSVRQPWANMIASGRKTVETRTWTTNYRGKLLIISSRKPPMNPAGCAVAIADLVECRPMIKADEPDACCGVYPGAKAWVLANVRKIKPFPVRGSLGLYRLEIDDSLIEAVPKE